MSDLNSDSGKSTFYRQALWFASSMLGLVAISFLFIPLILSMAPTDHDIHRSGYSIPSGSLNNLAEGKMTCLGEPPIPVFYGDICIYRRSSTQIDWLLENQAVKHREGKYTLSGIEGLDPRTRSFKPDYFIFSSNLSFYSMSKIVCDESGLCHKGDADDYWWKRSFWPTFGYGREGFRQMRVFPWHAEIIPGLAMSGGIMFFNQGEWDGKEWFSGPVYDLAGHPRGYSGWPGIDLTRMDGLVVPPHYFDSANNLIIGHSPKASFANRFRSFLSSIVDS